MSVKPFKASKAPGPNPDECLVCPFDSVHLIMPSRLAVHLIRCARNFPSTKKVRCPFNNTHVHSVSEMKAHVETCPNRSTLEHFMNPEKLSAVKPPVPNFVIPSTEDWDAEPPEQAYDPRAHCENEFIIRNPQGKAPAVRREFRERERRRFIDNDKF